MQSTHIDTGFPSKMKHIENDSVSCQGCFVDVNFLHPASDTTYKRLTLQTQPIFQNEAPSGDRSLPLFFGCFRLGCTTGGAPPLEELP